LLNDKIIFDKTKKGAPMATIQQKQLFVWNDIENLGDLERLILV